MAKSGRDHVDVAKAHRIEKTIRHDLMAELRVFAEQARIGGGKLHAGATSMDIEDNADAIIFDRALRIVESRLLRCLETLRGRILRNRATACMGWTHLQPAEPTTIGYRLANYAQDLVIDLRLVREVRALFLKGKGVKGAVGTSAGFVSLLSRKEEAMKLERDVMKSLGIGYFPVSTQTYPRKIDYLVLTSLASIAQSCHKFGLDLRVLQSPAFGELSEPTGEKQVGSSAMPSKRNPVRAERMCSLARYVSILPSVGFANAAGTILERTLDDSASRRIALPEAFLAVDECLSLYNELASGMVIHPEAVRKNLEKYGAFAGTEAVLMELVRLGADRQKMHELLRVKSFEAWREVTKGEKNPLPEMLAKDRTVTSKLSSSKVKALLDPAVYTGDAELRCSDFVKREIDPLLKVRPGGRISPVERNF